MQFLNIWGLVAAVAIPAVILLYLLKQQFEEQQVSSTYLWQKTIKEIEASKPWQKLRNSLLMILQLIAMAALVFALCRPYVQRQGIGRETLIIIDVSMSMQATENGSSRLDTAKDKAREIISAMMPGDRLTLMTAGKDPKVLISRSDDKLGLRAQVDSIQAYNGDAAIDNAMLIAQSLKKEIDGMGILVLTDHPIQHDEISAVNVAGTGDNVAVEGLTYAEDPSSGTYTLLARVHAFGPDREVTVECEIDGNVVDVKTAQLTENKTTNVYFRDIDSSATHAVARVSEADDLMADNQAFCYIYPRNSSKILLVTDRNLYLEKALSLRDDVEILKTTPEDAETLRGYDLYVLDGILPSEMPEDGALLIMNPPGAPLGYEDLFGYTVSNDSAVQQVRKAEGILADELLNYVNIEDLKIAKQKTINQTEGGDTVMALSPVAFSGEQPIIIAGENGNQRIMILGFDLHDSNWPVSKDFPIFVQNMLGWMIPQVVDAQNGIFPGDIVTLSTRATTRAVEMIMPSGESIALAPPFPVRPVSQSNDLGFYEIIQTDDQGQSTYSAFVVGAPVESESDLRTSGGQGDSLQDAAEMTSNKDITFLLILIALAVMLIEWWVYRRGY